MQFKFVLFSVLNFLFTVVVSSTKHLDQHDATGIWAAIVDISILMMSVPALLDAHGIENLELATQVFLDSSLNRNPTTIDELRVDMTSQSLSEAVELGANNNTIVLYLSLDLQIIVKYQPQEGEDSNIDDMDYRIRELFSKEWDELSSLLRLLDPIFYGPLHTIDLKPKPFILEPQNPIPEVGDGRQRGGDNPTRLSPTVLIVFVVVGIGVSISLLIIFPLFYLKPAERSTPSTSRDRTMSTSQSGFVQHTPHSSKEIAMSDSSTTISDLQFDQSGMCIQRIYSEDKVTNTTLSGLRVQKLIAETKLKQTLDVMQRSFDKPENRESGDTKILSLTTTSSTGNDTDPESPREMRPIQSSSRNRAEASKCPSEIPPRASCKDSFHHAFRPFWVAPGVPQSDDSSVSTMTGGCASSEGEDCELEVLSVNHLLPPANHQFDHTPSVSTADDFGSVAMSNPSTPRTRRLKSRNHRS